jgi:membrane fusion protein (multidrug efflux system)
MNIPGYAANPKRARALIAIAIVVAIAGIAYGIYWTLYLSHYQDTDDAYVQGNVVQVTPQIAGTVVQVSVQDTDAVKAGDLLVALDPADARATLDEAEATLAQTVREVRQVYGNDVSAQADIRFRQADAARAGAELARVDQDLARRRRCRARAANSRPAARSSRASRCPNIRKSKPPRRACAKR